jgi:hypothetical protein
MIAMQGTEKNAEAVSLARLSVWRRAHLPSRKLSNGRVSLTAPSL